MASKLIYIRWIRMALKKSCIASYNRQFYMDIKIKHKIELIPVLLVRVFGTTGRKKNWLQFFILNIHGRLPLIRCAEKPPSIIVFFLSRYYNHSPGDVWGWFSWLWDPWKRYQPTPKPAQNYRIYIQMEYKG